MSTPDPSKSLRARAYGLNLCCNRALPGLQPYVPHEADPAPDLIIRLGEAPPWAGSASTPVRVRDVGVDVQECGPGRLILQYPDATRFYLDVDHSVLWSTWPESLTLEDTATYLLGPVFGFVLRQRGHVCLHASAIMAQERCVAFTGPAGAGKSTLAAAFAMLGAAVLTEDISCLDDAGGTFSIRSGYPLVRLWEGSERLLPPVAGTLPLLTPNWDKRYLPLGDGTYRFHASPAPVGAIYVLTERRVMSEAAAIGELGGQDILSGLVANTYGNRLLDRDMRAHEFELLGRLAKAVPVRSLTLNADGSRLLEAGEWIRRHALS